MPLDDLFVSRFMVKLLNERGDLVAQLTDLALHRLELALGLQSLVPFSLKLILKYRDCFLHTLLLFDVITTVLVKLLLESLHVPTFIGLSFNSVRQYLDSLV